MTTYNNLHDFFSELYQQKSTDEEAMNKFQKDIDEINQKIDSSNNILELNEIKELLISSIDRHKKFYPNRTNIMLKQENALKEIIKKIETKIENL